MRAIAIYTSTITGKTTRAYRDSDTGEYCVKLIGAPKADYFTDDKDDALATMRAMADFPNPRLSRSAYNVDADIRRLEDARERAEAAAADEFKG